MFDFLIQSVQAAEVLEIGGWEISFSWHLFLLLDLVKYFLMILTVILLVAIILILIRVQGGFKTRIREIVEEAMEAGKLPKTKTQKKIDTINSLLESNDPEDYKKAVVLAEELFNKILKMANFSGENLKQRISKVSDSQLNFQEDILWAYNLKEGILTDEDFIVDYEEAKRAVYIFQRALKEVGVI